MRVFSISTVTGILSGLFIASFGSVTFEPSRSGANFHVAPRRVLDLRKLAAAGLPRRHELGAHLLDPHQPVGPPRARVLVRVLGPFLEVVRRTVAGPVLVFRL